MGTLALTTTSKHKKRQPSVGMKAPAIQKNDLHKRVRKVLGLLGFTVGTTNSTKALVGGNKDFDYAQPVCINLKVVLIGASGVGKTCVNLV